MIKYSLDYLNLIHLCKVTVNENKLKVTYYFDGKIDAQTFADQADFDEAVAEIEDAGLLLIGETWYNKDRLSIVVPNGANCGFHFIGNVFIDHEYADVSDVDAIVAEIESQFIQIGNKWYQGKQIHVAKSDPAALTINYDYLGMDNFAVRYDDQAAFDAALDKIKAIGEGGGSGPVTKKVATPRLAPTGGNIARGATVAITCSTSGAAIHYTTDGTTPTASSPAYSTPIEITADVTIKAIGVKDGMDNSNVASGSYVVVLPKVATPTITPNGGTVAAGSTVALACATDGATIYYTLDGSVPSEASTEYTAAIAVPDDNFTLKAIAVKTDYADSAIVSASFVVERDKVAAPTFTPAAGAVTIGTTVAIACATGGAEIHYTTDNSAPTASSPVYSSPVEITANVTIKAIGIKEGMDNSNVASAAYTIAKVATPTFTPAAGAVDSGTTVAIACSTAGAEIHYTTDGTTPTSASAAYSTPIEITAATTIKAIAIKSDMADSSVGSASYTIKPATLYRWVGLYNMVDDGEGDVDPAYKLTTANASTLITGVSWIEANVYNSAAGSVVKSVADTKSWGTASNEKLFRSNAQAETGYQFVYAYPASLGELTSITNNGFPAISGYSHVTMTLAGAEYLVYFQTDPSGYENQDVTQSFN